MESKFHRWWLGSCVAALLLASWAGGFSVAVTAVFVVVYLTGVTLVGPDAEADVGLAAAEESPEEREAEAEPEPEAAPETEAKGASENTDDGDAEPYPDDADAELLSEAPADVQPSVVETPDEVETAAVVVETPDVVDTAAVVVETPEVVDTTAVVETVADEDAAEPEPSPA